MLLIQKSSDTIGDVLLEVVEEEAVVVQMVALGTEHGGAIGWDDVELFFGDGGDDNGAADGVNTGIGNAGNNHLARRLVERAEVVLDGGVGVVTLPVDGVDAKR